MHLKKLALLGLCSGLVLASEVRAAEEEDNYDPNSENEGYYLMSEEELMINLNHKGRELYNSLTPEGKQLALQVASRRCNHANACKGLNACKTDDNDCAGKGACKGQSKCAVGDKNLAVKLAAQYMKNKQ